MEYFLNEEIGFKRRKQSRKKLEERQVNNAVLISLGKLKRVSMYSYLNKGTNFAAMIQYLSAFYSKWEGFDNCEARKVKS